jgi:hypothetical protein
MSFFLRLRPRSQKTTKKAATNDRDHAAAAVEYLPTASMIVGMK